MIPEPRSATGCATCPTARCCVRFDPELTGADVRRLSAGLDLPPDDFARLTPADATQAGADGVRLDASPSAWLLRLRAADRALPGQTGRPCVFLVSLDDDLHRCGVYAQRPLRCRTFPTELTPMGVMVATPEAICPPGAWSIARTDLRASRLVHLRAAIERDVYRAWLARWNERAAANPTAPARFLEALLEEQAALDELLTPALDDPARLTTLARAWLGQDLDRPSPLAPSTRYDDEGLRAELGAEWATLAALRAALSEDA